MARMDWQRIDRDMDMFYYSYLLVRVFGLHVGLYQYGLIFLPQA